MGDGRAGAPEVGGQSHVVLHREEATARPAVERDPGHAGGQRRAWRRQRLHLDTVEFGEGAQQVSDVRADSAEGRSLAQTAGIDDDRGRAHQSMLTWAP